VYASAPMPGEFLTDAHEQAHGHVVGCARFAEYGRIGKTLHLLNLADDDAYRRSLLIQVNRPFRASWLGGVESSRHFRSRLAERGFRCSSEVTRSGHFPGRAVGGSNHSR
jgi:hypothetical protein